MNNKIVLITGANSGIGLETARALAGKGAHVVMACRDTTRADTARQSILASHPNAKITLLALDLADLQSVCQCAEQFGKQFSKLDVLINNAGIVPYSKQFTAQGFEMQFGVNHLGHFLLTQKLLPYLKSANSARVVSVTSMIHRTGNIDFDSFKGEKGYMALKAYGQSKLANVLFTKVLAEKYKEDGITAYCLHPGAVATNIAGRTPLKRKLYALIMNATPEEGAQNSIYLASEPNIEQFTGGYFTKKAQHVKPSKRAQNQELADRLWGVSEELVRSYING